MHKMGATMSTNTIRFQRFLSLKAYVFDVEEIQCFKNNEIVGHGIVWN